jgi:hypothetical protein
VKIDGLVWETQGLSQDTKDCIYKLRSRNLFLDNTADVYHSRQAMSPDTPNPNHSPTIFFIAFQMLSTKDYEKLKQLKIYYLFHIKLGWLKWQKCLPNKH